MPLFTYQGGAKRPCGAEYRQGSTCRFGAHNCKFDHTLIDSLAPETQKLWHAHVKVTEGMSFNITRVKSGVAAVNTAVKSAASNQKPPK